MFTRGTSSVYLSELFPWHWLLRGSWFNRAPSFIIRPVTGLPSGAYPPNDLYPCTAPFHVTSELIKVSQWEISCRPRRYLFQKNALLPHCCSFIERVQKPPPQSCLTTGHFNIPYNVMKVIWVAWSKGQNLVDRARDIARKVFSGEVW